MDQVRFCGKSGDFDESCTSAFVQIMEPLNFFEGQERKVSFSIRVRVLSSSSQIDRSRSMNCFKSTIIAFVAVSDPYSG